MKPNVIVPIDQRIGSFPGPLTKVGKQVLADLVVQRAIELRGEQHVGQERQAGKQREQECQGKNQ